MRIVVAMSGGVDSSVAAALLVEQGHEVIGVHMKLHDVSPSSACNLEKRCCGDTDARDARLVADALGIPFYVMNLQEAFQKAVMDDLADEYVAGRTPNPCVRCNGVLKFKVLLSRAIALGADRLATGHYARIVDGHLCAAADPAKDQSYFLWPMPAAALAKTLFPLGEATKTQVREHARRFDLSTAEKPESMEICFVPDGDHAATVKAMRPEVEASGDLVDTEGKLLGHHDGYYRFTVGQRRGLGIALGAPAYVLRIEPESRRVVLGFDRDLWHRAFTLRESSWFQRPSPGQAVAVRVRHRGARVPCAIDAAGRIELSEPARAVTPGQSAVFYAGDQVLGGGIIAGVA